MTTNILHALRQRLLKGEPDFIGGWHKGKDGELFLLFITGEELLDTNEYGIINNFTADCYDKIGVSTVKGTLTRYSNEYIRKMQETNNPSSFMLHFPTIGTLHKARPGEDPRNYDSAFNMDHGISLEELNQIGEALGFDHVSPMTWHQGTQRGPAWVSALPNTALTSRLHAGFWLTYPSLQQA